ASHSPGVRAVTDLQRRGRPGGLPHRDRDHRPAAPTLVTEWTNRCRPVTYVTAPETRSAPAPARWVPPTGVRSVPARSVPERWGPAGADRSVPVVAPVTPRVPEAPGRPAAPGPVRSAPR